MMRTVDEGQVLQLGVTQLQQVTGVPVAFGGFVAGGGIPLVVFRGTHTNALSGLIVRVGTGLGGKVAAKGRPLAVSDYLNESGISHEYDPVVAHESLRSIAAVPVVVDRAVAAVMYAGLREATSIGDRTLAAAMSVARHVAQEIKIGREVDRRVAAMQAEVERSAMTATALEGVRGAYADLRLVALEVEDETLRTRLEHIGGQLAWATAERVVGAPRARLSAREVDVLALVAVGCRNADVAERLGVSPETVKSYLRAASRKLGATGRGEAVVLARRAGVLP